MAKVATIEPQGPQFLIHTDDYDVCFDNVDVTGTFKSGTILADAATAVSSTSGTDVLGIVAEDTEGGPTRIMTRGTPNLVSKRKLIFGDAVQADVIAALNAKQIVVTDDQ